jgi:molecular chaperone DnaK
MEKQIKEHEAKIPAETKKMIEEKLEAVRAVLKNESATAEEITANVQEAGTAAQEIGKIVYEASQKEQAAAGEKKEPEVVDAEVVENAEEGRKDEK